MVKRLKTLRKSNLIKYIVGFSFLTVLIILLVVKTFTPKPIINPLVSYHGPNPITMRKALESELVLGKSNFGRRNQTRITPIVRPPTPTLIPPTPTLIPPTPTPMPLPQKGDYGIAAGGGLIYLGQSDLNVFFSNLQSLGVKWVRWDIDWGLVQPDNSSSYKWDAVDRVAETAKRYGINSLGIITYTPKWAADPVCSNNSKCEPADSVVFGQFAGQVALRYKGTVDYWEIWNEPNYAYFWEPKPDAKKYSDILKEAYLEIKKENPNATILSGGLASTGNESDGSISPLTFMQSLYSLNANQYFNAVSLHPYTYPALPNYPSNWNSWQQMSLIRQIMVNKGDSAKKIWVTEYGAPTGGPGSMRDSNELSFTYGSDYMSETAQKEMVQQAVILYNQSSDWIGPFFWYSFHDIGTSKDTPENFFGLMRYDWSKKPAYDTFYSLIHQ